MRNAEVKRYTSSVFLLSPFFLGLILSCDKSLNYFPVSSESGLTVDQLKQMILFHGGLAVFIQFFIYTSQLASMRSGACQAWFDSQNLLNLPLCLLYFTLSFVILDLNEGAVGPLNGWLNPSLCSLPDAGSLMACVCTMLDVRALRLLLHVMPADMANEFIIVVLIEDDTMGT